MLSFLLKCNPGRKTIKHKCPGIKDVQDASFKASTTELLTHVTATIATMSALQCIGKNSPADAKDFMENRLKARGLTVSCLPLHVQETLQSLASSL
jgi:hypothetical protein